MSNIILPHQWTARGYQSPVFEHMLMGGLENKRALELWHRRAGKDSFSLNFAALASQIRVGTVWHMLPTQKQGRKVIWDGISKDGKRMIDQAFPAEMRESMNNTEMQIKFKNGSIYQVVGSDNYDSLVGANPVGVIFSEYSIADPKAWDFIRPILAENDGWAIFIYTPRGKNHGYKLYNLARENASRPGSRWHVSRLTVDDTFRDAARTTPVISPAAIQEERDLGMAEEKIQQEFYCSFDTGMEGAFYTRELNKIEADGRLGDFPHNPMLPVQTWWDIGFRDATSVIFTQTGHDGQPIIIDYLEERNQGLPFWVKTLASLPYVYATSTPHNGPHDLENHDWSTGKTRQEMADSLGLKFTVVPKIPVPDGIDAVRAILGTARFNKKTTGRLWDALTSYRRDYDERNNIFRDNPLHDWASHGSDAMRYLAVGWDGRSDDQLHKIGNAIRRRFKVLRTNR